MCVETSATESVEGRVNVVPVTCQPREVAIRIGSDVITPTDVVRDLGVIFNSDGPSVTSQCVCPLSYIRRSKQIRQLFGPDITARLSRRLEIVVV